MKKQIPLEESKKTLEMLCERFPNTFFNSDHKESVKPLKNGIRREILALSKIPCWLKPRTLGRKGSHPQRVKRSCIRCGCRFGWGVCSPNQIIKASDR